MAIAKLIVLAPKEETLNRVKEVIEKAFEQEVFVDGPFFDDKRGTFKMYFTLEVKEGEKW